MPKSNKKRKNGKAKKYSPKPKGISKSKLEDLLRQFRQNGMMATQDEIAEIRMDSSDLEIGDESKKSYNMLSTKDEINDGPELSQGEISSDAK